MIKGKLSKWHIHKQQLLLVSCVGLYQSLAMQSLIVIIPKAFNGKGTLQNFGTRAHWTAPLSLLFCYSRLLWERNNRKRKRWSGEEVKRITKWLLAPSNNFCCCPREVLGLWEIHIQEATGLLLCRTIPVKAQSRRWKWSGRNTMEMVLERP